MPVVPLKNVYEFERYLRETDSGRPRQPPDPAAPSRVLTQRQLAHRLRMLEFAMRRDPRPCGAPCR